MEGEGDNSCWVSVYRLRSTGIIAVFWAPGSTVDTRTHVSSGGFSTSPATFYVTVDLGFEVVSLLAIWTFFNEPLSGSSVLGV